jgi:hypothetical protein
MAPTPVGTRLPRPSETADTINGFLRIESGGGVLRPAPGLEQLMWDVSLILHAYAPNSDEALAEELIGWALAWGSNAQGTTTAVGSDDWYVAYSTGAALPTRQADPLVNLTRYRAMVSWRIPGLPVVGNSFVRASAPAAPALTGPRPTRRKGDPR